METSRGSLSRRSVSKAALLFYFSMCFFIFSVCSLNIGTSNRSRLLLAIRSSRMDSYTRVEVRRRNLMGGPGSYPPRCIAKCGTCTPCRAVRVTVPPGTPVTAEYYPEAWRCKCGNKLYNP